ncbi:hypothetical protein ABW19_dt0203791 [Dactylella cylindrospora]|nr:hypothetical protein ABW19_dt0203791 [Dactylella cylindrospora]
MEKSTNTSLEALNNADNTTTLKNLEAGMRTPQTLDVNNESSEEATVADAPTGPPALSDARLYIIGAGIWVSLFLAAFETTVVATCLVDISTDFQDFNRSSWIVVVYLLTYNGFLLLSSKLCDILGIKTMFLAANLIFGVFSVACGAAQNMTQLIILRAFQGIGGGGIYCIAFILMMSIITKEKLGTFSAGISSVFAIASISGPLLGGAITQNTTWRWIFYLNGPGIAVAFIVLFFAIPEVGKVSLNKETLSRIDYGGGFLSVAWSILLVYALQEGGAEYPWGHSVIIGTLASGILGLFLFAGYEWYIARKSSIIEPIFPLRLLKDPGFTYLVLTTFCIGVPIYVTIINMPQRYQIVNGVSPIRSGVLLLPMLVTSPIVSLVPGILIRKHYRYMGILFVVGGALSVIGSAGIGTIGRGTAIETKAHVYLVFIGLGMGLVMPASIMFVKFICDLKDEAVALGAQNMTRVLGGLVGLAIATAILHQRIEEELPGILTQDQLHSLLKSPRVLATLQPEQVAAVKGVYASSYDLQFNMSAAFAGLGFIFSCLTAWYTWDAMKKDIFNIPGIVPSSKDQARKAKEKAQDV